MIIGLVRATLSLPESRSLKDKRRVLRSLKDRTLNRMNVSVAEVGRQDQWQMAEMAFVTVAAEAQVVQQRVSEICSMLQTSAHFLLVDLQTENI